MFKTILKNIVRFSAAAIFASTLLPMQSANAAEPVLCAEEGGSCFTPNQELRDIYYCAGGVCNHMLASGTFNCNNRWFGDPAPGAKKWCYIGDDRYSYRNPEYEHNFKDFWTIIESDPVIIGFGTFQTNGWNARVLGSGNCDKYTFGDSAYGYTKSCYKSNQKFTYCANENGACDPNVPGTYTGGIVVVAYGSHLGSYKYRTFTSMAYGQTIACNNSTFGDPAPGDIYKRCYIKRG